MSSSSSSVPEANTSGQGVSSVVVAASTSFHHLCNSCREKETSSIESLRPTITTENCCSNCGVDIVSVKITSIDNSSKMLEKMARLYADRLLSDITLEVGGKKYAAHRLILCASSDVFQVMLMNSNWNEFKSSHILLKEDKSCQMIFPEFLKYLYTGRIDIHHKMVLPLLILGDKYNIKDLVNLCISYMKANIVKGAQDNLLVSWFQYSLNASHLSVSVSCVNFICWNFEFVAEKSDFGSFETEVLISFLTKDDLVVKDELTLFNCVSRWLMVQEKKLPSVQPETSSFESLVTDVMKHIRFPMMSPRQLASLLLNSLVIKYKEFFVDQMASAMAFHEKQGQLSSVTSGHLYNRSRSSSSGDEDLMSQPGPVGPSKRRRYYSSDLALTPRLYTTEKWSSSLVTENYHSLTQYGSRTLVFTTPSALFETESELPDSRSVTPTPVDTTSTSVMSGYTSGPNYKQSSMNRGIIDRNQNEWAIDLYPKGLWFKKFYLIVWQGRTMVEAPESVVTTVRLSVTAVRPREDRVRIGILVYGRQDDDPEIEYVKQTITRNFTFTRDEPVLHINDLIPYASLNIPAEDAVNSNKKSDFLIGPHHDTFKLHIIITPLNDY